jgi:putative glutamine amidotransferase
LHTVFQQDQLATNSLHHQAIKAVACGFRINAKTSDGIIEGIEHELAPFVLGVQWHPEAMVTKHPLMLTLFQALVKAAQKAKHVSS